MKRLIVVAMPEAAVKIVSLDDSTPEPLNLGEWMCWSEEIIPLICDLLDNGVIAEEIIFYGPRDYVKSFKKKLENITNIPIKIGVMK